MAEVCQQPEPFSPSSAPFTVKKPSEFLPLEDFILVREIAALRAHVTKYGAIRATYAKVADKVNDNHQMTQKVT